MNETHESPSGVDQRFAFKSLMNSGLRFFGWFVFLVIGLMFVSPRFHRMFEQYGLNLPWLTNLFLALSHQMIKLWFILLPISMLVLAGQEALILQISLGLNRRILNRIAWLLFLIVVGLFFVALASPSLAIWQAVEN